MSARHNAVTAQQPNSSKECAHRRPVVVNVTRAARERTRAAIEERLLRVEVAVERDPAAAWSISTMAAIAAMAPHHFARNFSRCFGETPRLFVQRMRLERAAALLRTRALTVTDACFEVGYTSLSGFSAAFRRFHGVPPSYFQGRHTHLKEAVRTGRT